jgi:palmitoyltransferase
MLVYGAYLAFIVLAPLVEQHYSAHQRWYQGSLQSPAGGGSSSYLTSLDEKVHSIVTYMGIALDVGGICLSGVGLLALLTWPLPFGLLGYHIYLIWAGMTTNESAKWADWRDDMNDGVVFLGSRKSRCMTSSPTGFGTPIVSALDLDTEEPPTTWPLESRHILIRTLDGKPPNRIPSRIETVAEEGSFRRCWNLSEVENVYDLGFWDNLIEAMR